MRQILKIVIRVVYSHSNIGYFVFMFASMNDINIEIRLSRTS